MTFLPNAVLRGLITAAIHRHAYKRLKYTRCGRIATLHLLSILRQVEHAMDEEGMKQTIDTGDMQHIYAWWAGKRLPYELIYAHMYALKKDGLAAQTPMGGWYCTPEGVAYIHGIEKQTLESHLEYRKKLKNFARTGELSKLSVKTLLFGTSANEPWGREARRTYINRKNEQVINGRRLRMHKLKDEEGDISKPTPEAYRDEPYKSQRNNEA